jgi:hypothetical protein
VGDEGANDKGLTLSGGLKLNSGAILRLNDAMLNKSYSNGQQIQAFTGSVSSGTFAEIIPATPGDGLKWDTSALYINGVLKVIGDDDEPGGGTDPVEPVPTIEKKTAMLYFENMTTSSDGTIESGKTTPANNILTGNNGTAAEGFVMKLTGNMAKSYYPADDLNAANTSATTIKLSNGAMNTIYVPDGYVATSMTIWSYTNFTKDTETPRTSYWVSVGGKTYTAETAKILQPRKDTSKPDQVSFELDNLSEIEFKNTGEQQCVVISIDYQNVIPGDVNGSAKVDADDVTALANHLTGNTPTGFILEAADLTDDGKVDITDLTKLIKIIIGGKE